MKAVLFLSLLLSTQVHAQAVGGGLQTPDKEIIISDRTHRLEVALNTATVLCLTGDYGAHSFKIAVPEINDITYLDHTSPGAPGPCINAGFCKNKEQPWGASKDERFPIFHDVQKPTEMVDIRVIRKELLQIAEGRCLRTYMEQISSTIRGTLFQHYAHMPLAETKLEDCM